MVWCKKIRIVIMILLISGCFFSAHAYSQQVNLDKATRDFERTFLREEIEEKFRPSQKEIPKEEEKEVAGAFDAEPEGPKFFIEKITLIGMETFSPEEFEHVAKKYLDKEVTFQEIKNLAKRIESEYLKKGVMAACFVPPQEITDKEVILQIVETRMGELQIGDHKYYDKDRIKYFWSLKPGDILRYDEMSRSISFMNKAADRNVAATLRSGKEPGTTDVMLDAETRYPLHSMGSLDLEGASTTGIIRTKLGFRHNNFMGFDDSLIAGYLFGRYLGAIYFYHNVPITNFGTTLLYGYSQSKANPQGDFAAYDIAMKAHEASIFIYQDIFYRDKRIGDINFGLDAKNKITKMGDTGTINRDRLRIFRAGGNFLYNDTDSVVSISPKFSQGLNFFGSRRKDRLSSGGANNVFSKFNIDIEYAKNLPFDLRASMKAKGQLTFMKLAPQEQLSLGGMNSVRGYPGGDYLADTGIQTNIELLFSPNFLSDNVKIPYAARPLKEELTGLVFFDYAYGTKRNPNTWTDLEKTSLASVGTGLRLKLFDQALVRLEWGFPLGQRFFFMGKKPSSGSPAGRMHLSLDFEDNFPAEFARIGALAIEEYISGIAFAVLNAELTNPESMIREKLYNYFYLAERAYDRNNLEEAQFYYESIINISAALFEDVRGYVKASIEHRKELAEFNDLAMKYYKNREFEKAREMWWKVITEAEARPLMLEFQVNNAG
ncbi:MAG: ShlB/FhaC/HecB family hemolysin secretion/activation protein [Candidatus Omnitrophica bacterium]|nr:ShlB/FhaC/HecB family hemolysin secretion/activation protein [Candidatus Omnitrophota bacterium]